MREIKFRAWDKKNKKMHLIALYEFGMNRVLLSDEPSEVGDFFRDIVLPSSFSEGDVRYVGKDVELMQYTGLKDKNGVEIWEGDVVEFKEPRFESGIEKAQVIFSLGCFCAGSYPFSDFRHPDMSLEVIGNIYENPDLLSNQKPQ